MEINDAFFDVESAARLIGNARKILTENELLSKEFSTADDLLQKRNKISRYSTGSSNFDAFLNGGFETQSNNDIAKKKCSWLECDSPATEQCVYCGRKYCLEHSVRHELERHGNKT